MNRISKCIAESLEEQGIIKNSDLYICQYGLEAFISSFVEVGSILIISVLIGNFIEALLLFIAFIPLRLYAGGFHANTRLRCYLVSIGVYIVFTIILKTLPSNLYFITNLFGTGFNIIIVFLHAPVIHDNRTVSDIEKKHYRKFSIYICMVESIVILILTILNSNSSFAFSLLSGQIAVSFSMIAAIVKSKLQSETK